MADNRVSFSIGDMVCWDKEIFCNEIGAVEKKFGKGPFKVVGVRLITQAQRRKMLPKLTHPEAITIVLLNKRYVELAGDWFKKI